MIVIVVNVMIVVNVQDMMSEDTEPTKVELTIKICK